MCVAAVTSPPTNNNNNQWIIGVVMGSIALLLILVVACCLAVIKLRQLKPWGKKTTEDSNYYITVLPGEVEKLRKTKKTDMLDF